MSFAPENCNRAQLCGTFGLCAEDSVITLRI